MIWTNIEVAMPIYVIFILLLRVSVQNIFMKKVGFALPFILMHFSHLELFEKNSMRRPVNSECPHVDISTELGVENCSFRNVRVKTPTGRQVFSR